MKSGKKIVVAILIVLILILIAGGAFAYVYMATDLLKTDEELFYKYFAQISSEDGFIDNRIQEFNNKKEQTPYENSGEITVGAKYPEESLEKIIKKVNELSIRFSGKKDKLSEKVEQNIEVDYGEDVIFPISYRKDGDKFGLKFDELSKQFISVRNENLKEFATKFGMEDVSELPNKIELTENYEQISFTDEEIEQLKQIYGSVLQQNILEENFSSIKTKENESYTLELTSEQIKNLIVKMLETTKENTLIIDKLNEIILAQDPEADQIDVSVIDEIIADINGENTSNSLTGITDKAEDIMGGINEEDIADIADIPNLRITLVQSDKKLTQIIMQFGDNTISINKNIVDNSLSYGIECKIIEDAETSESNSIFEEEISEPVQANIYLNLQYIGLDTLVDVQENYEIGFNLIKDEESMLYEYKINCNTQFVDSVSIENLDKNVSVFLNDYNGEQITTFMTNVGTKLQEINKTQMEKLGLKEYENPVLYSNPLTSMILFNFMVYNMAIDSIPDVDLSQQEIDAFNSMFTQYVGEDRRGSEINAMIKTVQNNNLTLQGEDAHLVTVTLNGTEISENVESDKMYNVEAVYDLDGYIIEMNVTTKN